MRFALLSRAGVFAKRRRRYRPAGGVAVTLDVVRSGWFGSTRSGDRSAAAEAGAPRRFGFLLFAVLLGGYYWVLLTSGSRNPFLPVPLGMVFNSMADHLVHGSFEVSPSAIGFEGFVRDGGTYAYFGVFCAALRMPLLLIPGGIATDITALSSWAAIMLGVWFKLRSLSLVARMVPGGRDKRFMIALCTAAVLLSGPRPLSCDFPSTRRSASGPARWPPASSMAPCDACSRTATGGPARPGWRSGRPRAQHPGHHGYRPVCRTGSAGGAPAAAAGSGIARIVHSQARRIDGAAGRAGGVCRRRRGGELRALGQPAGFCRFSLLPYLRGTGARG